MGLYDRDWYSDAHRQRDEAPSQILPSSALVQIRPAEQLTANGAHSDNGIFINVSSPHELPPKRRSYDYCPKCRHYNPNSRALCFQCGHIQWGLLFFCTGMSAACLVGAALGYLHLPGTTWPHLVGYGLGFVGFVLVCMTTGEWIAVVSSNRNDLRSAGNAAKLDRSH